MSHGGARASTWRQVTTLLAMVVLAVRLVMPAPAMFAGALASDVGLAGLLGEVPICHADSAPAPASPADRPAVPAHDCALCPVCQLAAAPALIAMGSWLPEPWSGGPVSVAPPPPSTGPPSPLRYAAPPRGPPASAV